jgi:AcrR family transcriptional regulator
MPAAARAVSLGNAELGRLRHICGLFDGEEEEARTLDRFVVEGLVTGERVIHVVKSRDAYLERLGAVIDVSAATASGQLDVRSWDDAYLADGEFHAARVLTLIRRTLREGRAQGFRATRLIGDMRWSVGPVRGVEELAAYEREVGTVVSRPYVSVVCAYDTKQHDPAQLAAVVPLHQAVLAGGRLELAQRNGPLTSPRARILAAAEVLFAEKGINRTGVDALIDAAGVAKATFYRHFPSKERLILAWLHDPRTRWFDRIRVVAESRAATPADVIPRVFEAVAEWLEGGDFIGCPYLNTSVEVSDPGHPAADAVRDYLAEVGAYLEERVAAAGHDDAPRLGRELHTLLAGSISLGVANRTSSFVMAARDAAVELLEE